MTSLFGIPEVPTINDLIGTPQTLKFNQWLQDVFQPIGINGPPDLSTDPMATLQYLKNKRQVILDSANQKPLIRIADKNLEIRATVSGEMSATFEELMDDSGKGIATIRFDHWLTDWIVNKNSIFEDLHLLIDPIPTQPDWRTRWGGKIQEINIKNNEDGTATVELHAISMREHCKKLLFAANPIFPPEIQLPRMWVLPGPIRSILFLSMFINLARIFVPGLSFITNAFNPAAWINPLNPDALLNFNPLSWPLQVAFVNPVVDQSRWSVLGATWTDWHSSMGDMLSDAGVVCRAYTWLTTDKDSPHTELTSLINGVEEIGTSLLDIVGLSSVDQLVSTVGNDVEQLTRPTRNAVIFSLEDDSGQTGPTGTALDGLLNLIAVTGDDLITSTLFDTGTGQTLQGEPIIDAETPVTPIIQSLLGVAPAPPKVIWRDGQFTGMIKREVTMHKAPILTVMTGGRSPAIVNETQTFLIKYGLSQLSDVINQGIADNFGTPLQAPGTPGLDSLYQGQLDNCVAKDTVVQGPDGGQRIDVLAARGRPFRVWSLTPDGERVAAVATHAFKKGAAPLFEYTLDNGRTITATAQHKFLTDSGFVYACNVESGTQMATSTHLRLPPTALTAFPEQVCDSQYEYMPESDALIYRKVEEIRPVGVHDYYDMHVPGWENYSANGIWNHNTLLAWERYTDPIRALWSGDLQFQEYFDRGSSTAYTMAGWLTLREANFKTRPFYGFTTDAINGRPWLIDVDVRLGQRAGFEIGGVIYVDQITAVKRTYDRKTPVVVSMSVGNDRDRHDPIAQGIRAMQAIWMTIGSFLGEGTLFG